MPTLRSGYTTQSEVDAAFAALDECLAARDTTPQGGCRNCGSFAFDRGSNPGTNCGYYNFCRDCGAVAAEGYGLSDNWATTPSRPFSNYKRIHHFHERVSQLLLHESQIPDEHFLQIAQRLLDGSHPIINKDVIRGVLRSLNFQLYIEKWLQIIQRCTGIEPPKPGGLLLKMLDNSFVELQQPFLNNKVQGRKNFLNYNYVFCRLFQKLNCTQFCMFFPLIKSKQKLRVLDEMWASMVEAVGWEFTPLQHVAPFAVKLEKPELLLQQIVARGVRPTPVVQTSEQKKTEFRKSDLRLLRGLDQQKPPKRHRSNPPEQELQKLGSSVKRPPSAAAAKLQQLLRSKRPLRPE